jgi:outer membrane receptor for ferric coprogen and ferric-rhodotorulic acid
MEDGFTFQGATVDTCSAPLGTRRWPSKPVRNGQLEPGDHIPGIPSHRFKIGFDYRVTPQWRIGGDVIAVAYQFFRGDEGNDDRPLPGYVMVNQGTGYKVTDNVEVYALANTLFGTDYTTFGTYFGHRSLAERRRRFSGSRPQRYSS